MLSFKQHIKESWDDRSWSRAPQGVNTALPFSEYDDTGKSSNVFEPKKVRNKDPHVFYKRHQTSVFMLDHLSKAAGAANQTNIRQHYENKLEVAKRKRDWWANQNFTDQGFDQGKAGQLTKEARFDAMHTLHSMGHSVNIPESPYKAESSRVVDNTPKTADGRIQFGTGTPVKNDDSALKTYGTTKYSANDKPRVQFGVKK